jgi:thiosulfate reductase cytochrome b subunit
MTAPAAETISRDAGRIRVHSAAVRVWHWLNVAAMAVMIMSGWRIYNASPLFDFRFPPSITLGGWLGGALQWHFAAMWLLVANLLGYLVYGLVSGHFRRAFLPFGPRAVAADLALALRAKLPHRTGEYNAVQRLFYVGVLAAILLTILSGFAVWKPVQAQGLASLFGGYEGARLVHFAGMALICLFIAVHLALVLIVPSTLLPMVTGTARVRKEDHR